MSYYPDGKRNPKKGKGRRRYNMRNIFIEDGHFVGRRGIQPTFDPEEAHYWELIRQREGLGDFHDFKILRNHISQSKKRPEVQGFTRKELVEYLKDLYPKLRHKEDEILNFMEKKKILQPIDYICDLVSPEEATDIFTTNIPEIIDDTLSIEQIIKWLMDDVKLVLGSLIEFGPGDLEREETLEWAGFVVETYRKGLKSLRRKVKAEKEERELEKLVEYYEPLGLSISMEELFGDDQALINSLEGAGIRYLFQLISKSKSEISEITGIGITRMERIENLLLSRDLKFLGKEPEKKNKKKKETKTKIKAKIVNI